MFLYFLCHLTLFIQYNIFYVFFFNNDENALIIKKICSSAFFYINEHVVRMYVPVPFITESLFLLLNDAGTLTIVVFSKE